MTGNQLYLYVERREVGDWTVRKANGKRALAVEKTQAQAIAHARVLSIPKRQSTLSGLASTPKGSPDK